MKALILAAGFGKRLLPYTEVIPKPMFPIGFKPVLAHTIEKLIKADVSEIFINTHHLHRIIENYIQQQTYPVTVTTVYEPEILDTGGAVKNIMQRTGDSDLIVINSDILFDMDLLLFIKNHQKKRCPASLVLHKIDRFNKIEIDKTFRIKSFNSLNNPYAFTGIQILSPEILKLMPDRDKFSIIDFYQGLINDDYAINAFVPENTVLSFWEDIGLLKTYKHACLRYLVTFLLKNKPGINAIQLKELAGDGSDREWFRIFLEKKTYIAGYHGINVTAHDSQEPGMAEKVETTCQLDSFLMLGRHLYSKGVPVPEIYIHDPFSGMAILEDLGDIHLETIINRIENNEEKILSIYKKVADKLFLFSKNGIHGFKKQWAFETHEYTPEMVVEKECNYFINSFVNTCLKKNIRPDTFLEEFEFIADNCTDSSFKGLMHRDMQSRNIMFKNGHIFFIDFQSARKGPVEYDLASLLIDPYVKLNSTTQNKIFNYFKDEFIIKNNFNEKLFKHCYKYCMVARNLQMLGAFGFLSVNKNKSWFKAFIPQALANLKKHINLIDRNKIPKLTKLINQLKD